MHTKLTKLCAGALMLTFTQMTVYATTVDYVLDENQNLIINGSVEPAVEGKNVYIQVLSQGRDKNNLKTEDDITDINRKELIQQLIVVDTASDGTFTYTYKMPETDGYFKVSANDGSEIDEVSFYFVTPTRRNEIVQELKNRELTPDYDSLKTKLIVTYAEALELNLDKYNSIKDSDGVQTAIFKNIFNEMPNINSPEELQQLFYTEVLAQTINLSDSDEIVVLLADEGNKQLLGMDLDISLTYKTLSETGKKTFYQNLNKTSIASGIALNKTIREILLTTAIEKVVSYMKINEIIEDNKDIIVFDYSRYNEHKDRDSIDKVIAGNKYTLATLGKQLDSLSSKPVKGSSGNGGSSAGTGGGSGGGGGLSIQIPNVEQKPSENKEIFTESSSFEDITSHWAKEYIEELYKRGVVNGINATRFAPDTHITREEFVKMLVELFGIDKDNNDEYTFTDVPAEHWSYTYVSAAKKYGILQGTGNNEFGLGEKITREDMMVMLYRVCNKMSLNMLKNGNAVNFKDYGEIYDYAKEAVEYMTSRGVVSGYEDGTFKGKNPATRGETAKILSAFLDYID